MNNSVLIQAMVANTLLKHRQEKCDELTILLMNEHREELQDIFLSFHGQRASVECKINAEDENFYFFARYDDKGCYWINICDLMLRLSPKSEKVRRYFNSIGFTK